jgi:hypothetical protein
MQHSARNSMLATAIGLDMWLCTIATSTHLRRPRKSFDLFIAWSSAMLCCVGNDYSRHVRIRAWYGSGLHLLCNPMSIQNDRT